jgi:transposase
MYIAFAPNKKNHRGVYLRESQRKGKITLKKTIANISDWPEEKIAALEFVLKGNTAVGTLAFKITRSLAHGAVSAILHTMEKSGLISLLNVIPPGKRPLVISMIADRLLYHQSKLATARSLSFETATNTLSEEVKLGKVKVYVTQLYRAMDDLLEKKPEIEKQLAQKHLQGDSIVLYDLTSVYFEGETCPLAEYGRTKEGVKGHKQVMVGLMTNKEGIPVSTEVFKGNIQDHATLADQIKKTRLKFGMARVIMVGDRGTIIAKRIEEEFTGHTDLSFITALKSAEIQDLVSEKSLKLSVFDETDLAEIYSPLYPGERLIACRNKALTIKRTQKREALLKATETELDKIVLATKRKKKKLKGKAKIGLRVGRVLGKYKMGKHILLTIKSASFSYQRNQESILAEQLLDGIYIIRTPLSKTDVTAGEAVLIYKGLSVVERAFRCMKTTDLHIRPVNHRLPDRVKSHVFLCMLAYYIEWHMRRKLAPILFEDEDKEEVQLERESVVAKAPRSHSAQYKAAKKETQEGLPVHSFQSLLADLATVTRNTIAPLEHEDVTFMQVTERTALQQKAFDLLGMTGKM